MYFQNFKPEKVIDYKILLFKNINLIYFKNILTVLIISDKLIRYSQIIFKNNFCQKLIEIILKFLKIDLKIISNNTLILQYNIYRIKDINRNIIMTLNNEDFLHYAMEFTIIPQCSVDGLKNFDEVEFKTEIVNNEKMLVGFHIFVKNPNEEESRLIALQRAWRLCNLMSLNYRFYIQPSLIGFTKIKRDGTEIPTRLFEPTWTHVKNLNLDGKNTDINNLLEDDIGTKICYHIAKGIKAYHDKDYPESIRQFYQVVEKNPTRFPTLEKYEPLRHALSHFGGLYPKTINDLHTNFGSNYFQLTPTNSFDYLSPSNLKLLEKEAETMFNEITSSYHP